MKKILLSFFVLCACISNSSLAQKVYTFNGNGNWSDTNNWVGHLLPPEVLPDSSKIIIDPVINGLCILDTSQIIAKGAKFIVNPGKNFIIKEELIQKDSTTDLIEKLMSDDQTSSP